MLFRGYSTNIISSLVYFNVIFHDENMKNISTGLLDENVTECFSVCSFITSVLLIRLIKISFGLMILILHVI